MVGESSFDLGPHLLPNPAPIPVAKGPGGLRGPLMQFLWVSPANLAAQFPSGILPLPQGAAIAIIEPAGPVTFAGLVPGSGYFIGFGGGGGGTGVQLPVFSGSVFSCGAAGQDQGQLVINSANAVGGLFITIWDLPSGMARAQTLAASGSGWMLMAQQVVVPIGGGNVFTQAIQNWEPFAELRVTGIANFTGGVNGQLTLEVSEFDTGGNPLQSGATAFASDDVAIQTPATLAGAASCVLQIDVGPSLTDRIISTATRTSGRFGRRSPLFGNVNLIVGGAFTTLNTTFDVWGRLTG